MSYKICATFVRLKLSLWGQRDKLFRSIPVNDTSQRRGWCENQTLSCQAPVGLKFSQLHWESVGNELFYETLTTADLALGQPANMTFPCKSEAALAVGGTSAGCAVTTLLTDPWWRVDLGTSYVVDVVDIIAGADGLTDFEIRVGEWSKSYNKTSGNLVLSTELIA